MNKKTIFILSFIILNVLTSCTDNSTNKEVSKSKSNYTNADFSNYSNNAIQKEVVLSNNEINQTLSIDDRCIWCWKCAIIAPQNFAMNYDTLKAVVTSQKDMFSSEVSTSIQVCPVDSIHIS